MKAAVKPEKGMCHLASYTTFSFYIVAHFMGTCQYCPGKMSPNVPLKS